MIAVVGALGVAVAGVAATILSTAAGRRPDRAAVAIVLVVAGAGAFPVLLILLGLMIVGMEDGGTGVRSAYDAVRYDPRRVAVGLGAAAALLVVAAWLIRTGDWHRPDDRPLSDGDDPAT